VYAQGSPASTYEGEPVFNHGTFQGGHTINTWQQKLVVYGGYNGIDRTKDLYLLDGLEFVGEEELNPEVKWNKQVLQNTQDRAGHVSWIRQDKLYSYGGYNTKHLVLSDIAEIDLASFQVTNHTNFKTKSQDLDRRWHCGSYLAQSDKAIIHGGWNDRGPLGDVLLYDFSNNSFETIKSKSNKESVPSARRWHTLNPLIHRSDEFFVFGGYTADSNNKSSILGDQYIFNLTNGTWNAVTTKGDKPAPRCRHTMSLIGTKQMILIGGYSGADKVKRHTRRYMC